MTPRVALDLRGLIECRRKAEMPKLIDGTIWAIAQLRHVDGETVQRALERITKDTPEPSPEDLESYDRYWNVVSTTLTGQFV